MLSGYFLDCLASSVPIGHLLRLSDAAFFFFHVLTSWFSFASWSMQAKTNGGIYWEGLLGTDLLVCGSLTRDSQETIVAKCVDLPDLDLILSRNFDL